MKKTETDAAQKYSLISSVTSDDRQTGSTVTYVCFYALG